MDLSGVWFWVITFISLVTAYWYLTKPKNLPPGTVGLPLVGYLPFLSNKVYETFIQLGKKFGNCFHVYIGSQLVIVLNDYEAIHEAFIKQGEVFSGRPPGAQFQEKKEDNLGLIATDGEYWRQHRRFILTNLRDYGVGKLTLEPMLLNEINFFLKEMRKNSGKNYEIKPLLSNTFANNIHILVTGKRYEYGHPHMKQLHQLMKAAEVEAPSINYLMFFPLLKYIPGISFFTKRDFIRNLMSEFRVITQNIVETVRNEYNEGDKENYVFAYLSERNNRLKTDKNEEIFTEIGLQHNTQDLLLAGTETSSVTIQWASIYMTLHPQVQKKVQAEIDKVIGPDREPSYNDRTRMPYTEATLLELQRMISLIPLSVPHRTTRNTTLFGYAIPKDAIIMPNLYAVHYEKKIWGDPHVFRPERFIGENGKITKSEFVVPFSLGKRQCAGEPLARMELFLYFVSLLQHFDFVMPDNVPLNLDVNTNAGALRPKCHIIKAVARSTK